MELCTWKQTSPANIVQVLARSAAAIAEQSVPRTALHCESPVESSGEVCGKRGSELWTQQTPLMPHSGSGGGLGSHRDSQVVTR